MVLIIHYLDKLMPGRVKPKSFGGGFDVNFVNSDILSLANRACRKTKYIISMCHCLANNWYII
jgi:hypothetical protein